MRTLCARMGMKRGNTPCCSMNPLCDWFGDWMNMDVVGSWTVVDETDRISRQSETRSGVQKVSIVWRLLLLSIMMMDLMDSASVLSIWSLLDVWFCCFCDECSSFTLHSYKWLDSEARMVHSNIDRCQYNVIVVDIGSSGMWSVMIPKEWISRLSAPV